MNWLLDALARLLRRHVDSAHKLSCARLGHVVSKMPPMRCIWCSTPYCDVCGGFVSDLVWHRRYCTAATRQEQIAAAEELDHRRAWAENLREIDADRQAR